MHPDDNVNDLNELNELNELIFISIASYRDSQLVPTIEDLLAKADAPGLLRFGICWQHGPEVISLPFAGDERFRILDVPFHESRGACWARAEAMKLWQGEQWFLQVDSHCRFQYRWDTKLIRMMAETGSPKPVLSTYGNAFTPATEANLDDPMREILSGPPHLIAIETFAWDGLPQLKPLPIPAFATRTRPMAARFLAGGFLFAPSAFIRDVPYDPELYFQGEETSMSLRAFTHGYDLFHPVEILVWHDYVRAYAARHWDDHTPAQAAEVAGKPEHKPAWTDLDLHSRSRVRYLLTSADSPEREALSQHSPEPFGLGAVRTLEDYEAYAGLSFHLRKMQDDTRRAFEPPNPPAPADWPDRIYTWLVRIILDTADLSPLAFDEHGFWLVAIQDENRQEIRRHDMTKEELKSFTGKEPKVVLVSELVSGIIPAFWVVWPFSRERGWGTRLEGAFSESDFSIIDDNPEAPEDANLAPS